jgi:exonuclease III
MLKAEPVDILIVQVYMPTSEYEDDEVEYLYDTNREILEEDGKGDTNSIILGDWSSIVGDESYRNIAGSRGLGRRNHRGQMLVDFCERNGLIVTNYNPIHPLCHHGMSGYDHYLSIMEYVLSHLV